MTKRTKLVEPPQEELKSEKTVWLNPKEVLLDKKYQARDCRGGIIQQYSDQIENWTEKMKEGDWEWERKPLPVVVAIGENYYCLDGFHRTYCAQQADIEDVLYELKDLDEQSALIYATIAENNNTNGIPLSLADRRLQVSKFLEIVDNLPKPELEELLRNIPKKAGQKKNWSLNQEGLISRRAIAQILGLTENQSEIVDNLRKKRLEQIKIQETIDNFLEKFKTGDWLIYCESRLIQFEKILKEPEKLQFQEIIFYPDYKPETDIITSVENLKSFEIEEIIYFYDRTNWEKIDELEKYRLYEGKQNLDELLKAISEIDWEEQQEFFLKPAHKTNLESPAHSTNLEPPAHSATDWEPPAHSTNLEPPAHKTSLELPPAQDYLIGFISNLDRLSLEQLNVANNKIAEEIDRRRLTKTP